MVDLKKVLRSTAIYLTEDELLIMEKSIARIEGFVAELRGVQVGGLEPLINPSSHIMEMRKDCVVRSAEAALDNAPDFKHGYICVPKVNIAN